MSRIRRMSNEISGSRSNAMNQAARLREAALALIDEANLNCSPSRRVTKKSAFTVVLRSLQQTKNLPFSLRQHMAMKDLSQFITLSKHNKSNSLTLSHTDLLPVSHPRSTRQHSMTASALLQARANWQADDPRITDENAKTILASALVAEVGSVEHTYLTTILASLPQGTIPTEALLAAMGDGNSPIARSLRAKLQRRDRKGRFAYMGGGLRALVRRNNGKVFSLLGRTLMDAPDGKVLLELPDRRIVKIAPERGEYVKAIINPTKDGFSAKPVNHSVTDDIIDEKDLEFVDAPDGWKKIGENSWQNEDNPKWFVDRFNDGKLHARKHLWDENDPNAEQIVQGAPGDNWADILDSIDKIESGKGSAEEKPTQKEEKPVEAGKFEFKYPDGAYKVGFGQDYSPEGRQDEDSPDFTDDPVELAQRFDVEDIEAALEQAVIPQESNDNAYGYGMLGFSRGDEMVDGKALYAALKEAGEDADLKLAQIYDKALGTDDNEKALADFRKAPEKVEGTTPQVEESFKRITEGMADVAPAAEEPKFVEEKRDETPLPPLLEGLTENELARFMESKDHTPHLPKNEDIQMPEGYNKLDPSPFNAWREVGPDNPDPALPDGFSDNPVFLAQNISKEDLLAELRRALEPGNEAPGYGAVTLKTEDGEDFTANVPGEAIRDALQLQGVDTNAEIQKIADEGKITPEEEQKIADEVAPELPAEEAPAQVAELPADAIPEDKLAPDFRKIIDARNVPVEPSPEDTIPAKDLTPEQAVRRAIRNLVTHKDMFGDGVLKWGQRKERNYNAFMFGQISEKQKKYLRSLLADFPDGVEKQAVLDSLDGKHGNELNGMIFNKTASQLIDVLKKWKDSKGKEEAKPVEEVPAEAPKAAETPNILDMMKEEDGLVQEFLAEGMTQGDAQGAAEAQMKIKYGTTPTEELLKLPREEGQRILDENQKRIDAEDAARAEAPAVEEKINIRPEGPQDFAVDKVEEIPDGNEEYPKPANVAPAAAGGGNPPPPHRIVVKVSDLKPGDITVGDHFVITEIGEKVPGTDRVKIKGYYPGHVEQDTKQWNEWREIEVIRGVQSLPEKGELPVLSKPKEKDFGKRRFNKETNQWEFANPADAEAFNAAMADYNVQLNAAKKRFADPTEPSNNPHRVISRAADLQPGDVTFDAKKGHFVIEKIFTDENTKPGFVSVQGYYPGHVSQRKEWKVDTPIEVVRNVEPPAKGDLPEIHRPAKEVNGKWRPDNDPAKNEEHQKALDEAAARWQVPADLPVIDNKKNVAEDDANIPNAVAVPRPNAPRMIEMPAFQGEMARIARDAGGDWNKFKELLKDQDIIFFDFETTGVNAEDGNEPWQVAAVRMRNGEIIDRKNIFMNPGRSINDTYAGRDTDGVPNAVDADGNKLTDEFLAQQVSQEEAMRQLIEWAGPDAIWGAQNMAFDEEVARRIADRHGLDWAPAGLLDTLPMAKDIYKDQPKENRPKTPKGRESYALGNLATHLGVKLENWHAADADAEAAAQIFNALIDKGIEFGAGKDLFDVDARNDEYVAKLDDYKAQYAHYEDKLAEYNAAKALRDGMQGKDVNIDKIMAEGQPNPAEGQAVDMGPVGKEPDPVRAKQDVVVLDFTPNVDFPQGEMRMMGREWVLDDANTVLLPREEIRMRDLLPGDFMQSRDGETIWQVVAVRAGEDFGLAPGRVKVFRRNIDTGEISTYEHWHGVFLDGVRRPINPRDLDLPQQAQEGEDKPFSANAPMDIAKAEAESKPNDLVYNDTRELAGVGTQQISIRKNDEGKFELKAVIFDENGNAIYSVEDEYRTIEGARAEGEALLKEHADSILAQKRQEENQPEEARAKDVPVSRGDIPGDAPNAPEYIPVDNIPEDLIGYVKVQNVGEDKPDFEAQAVVRDLQGDVLAHQVTNHPNKPEAEKEGRDFVNRVADAMQNPEAAPVEEKPKKQRAKKALTPQQIKAAEEQAAKDKDNDWVEANAGRLAPVEPPFIKVGDFFWEPFWGNYAEIVEAKYIGYLDRYEFKVKNRVTGQIETRYFKSDSPLRNVRREGVSDQEFEIPQEPKATNRNAKRGLVKRKALEERIVAKEGRPMGGKFVEEGFFRDKNGVALQPGDIVMHPKFGRGVVKKREGAQVEEGKKAGGVARGGKVYLDNLMVQFENEDQQWVINQGGRLVKAKKLEFINNMDEPINLPAFRGGKVRPVVRKGLEKPGEVPTPPKAKEAAPEVVEAKEVVAPEFNALDAAQIQDGLKNIHDQLEEQKAVQAAKKDYRGRDNARTIENAQRAINNFLADFDITKADKIDMDQLDAAIRRTGRVAGLEPLNEALRNLKNIVSAEQKRLEIEKEKNLVADINKPFAAIPAVEGLDYKQVNDALQEVIDRLPSRGASQNTRRLANAYDYLKDFNRRLKSNDDLLEDLSMNNIDVALESLNEIEGIDVSNVIAQVEGVKQAIAEYRRKNRKPFGKANMPEIDPIALREKRIADGENKFNLAQAPALKQEFANDDLFKENKFLAPYKDELQQFFAQDGEIPLAQLSADARQALAQHVRSMLSGGSAGNQARAAELARMIRGLHNEKLAFNPNRSDLGPAGAELLDIDPDAVFAFGQNMPGKSGILEINGQETPFKIQKIGDGINASYNYRLIHRETGQVFYFKRERGMEEADAEYASNQLARALGVVGAPVVERHNKNKQVLIMTNAGDSLDWSENPKVAGSYGKRDATIAKKAAVADLVAMGILDAIIYNTDRHQHNFLIGVNDNGNVKPNGFEEIQLLPIDHGFAQLFQTRHQRIVKANPVDWYKSGDGRNGAEIVKNLAEDIGAVNFKELVDMTIQEALQAIERGDYLGKEVSPEAKQKIIDRLEILKAIEPDKWRRAVAGRL